LGGRGRWISEFEASLVYKVSSRTARAIQRNPVSKNKNKNKKPQKTNKQTNKKTNKNKKKKRKKEEFSPTILLFGAHFLGNLPIPIIMGKSHP
jgi:cytoskeletal protein RodZ